MTDTVAGDRIDSVLDKTEFHSFFDETVGPAVKIAERDGEFASGIKGLDCLLATDARTDSENGLDHLLEQQRMLLPH